MVTRENWENAFIRCFIKSTETSSKCKFEKRCPLPKLQTTHLSKDINNCLQFSLNVIRQIMIFARIKLVQYHLGFYPYENYFICFWVEWLQEMLSARIRTDALVYGSIFVHCPVNECCWKLRFTACHHFSSKRFGKVRAFVQTTLKCTN